MALNNIKAHAKARRVKGRKTIADPPVCWFWNSIRFPARILFVDKTRNGKFAVYHVDDVHDKNEAQQKKRFAPLPECALRGALQIDLDEYAKRNGFLKCPKGTWGSVQAALGKGGGS